MLVVGDMHLAGWWHGVNFHAVVWFEVAHAVLIVCARCRRMARVLLSGVRIRASFRMQQFIDLGEESKSEVLAAGTRSAGMRVAGCKLKISGSRRSTRASMERKVRNRGLVRVRRVGQRCSGESHRLMTGAPFSCTGDDQLCRPTTPIRTMRKQDQHTPR